MNLEITEFIDINALTRSRAKSSGGSLFQQAVEDAIAGRSDAEASGGYTIISKELENKLENDPEFAGELAQKIAEMSKCFGKNCRDSIVAVDRNGEISRYCPKHDKTNDHPTAEELKAVAKARARRKARLDAYFRLVERISVKRKLTELENIKRGANKKYRYSPARIEMLAKSFLQKPSKNPEYYC